MAKIIGVDVVVGEGDDDPLGDSVWVVGRRTAAEWRPAQCTAWFGT